MTNTTSSNEAPYPKTVFSPAFIQQHGGIEDVLGEFLEVQMKDIQRAFRHRYPSVDKGSVQKLLGRFVTLEGTKRPMPLAEINPPVLNEEQLLFCLERMETARILRQEEGMFELAHDTLALHIAEQRSADEIAFLEVVKMIKDRHQFYAKSKTLLNANELQLVAYNKTALEKETLLDAEEWTYIAKSQRDKTNRLRLRQLLLVGLIAILSSFSAFSYFQSKKAQQKEQEAIEAQQAAEANLQQLKVEQAQKTAAKYKAHLALGKSLMAQDNHLEAIKEFETALAFNEYGEEAQRLQEEAASRAGSNQRFEQLIKEGATLEAGGAGTLVDALGKYQQALQLNFNNPLAERKLAGVQEKLKNAFDKFVQDGDAFFAAADFEFALKNYQQALRIKPNESPLKEKVIACKQKLNL